MCDQTQLVSNLCVKQKILLRDERVQKKPQHGSLFFQMLSCLEHMYHDLGLVKDFNINPITLKRWLVSRPE